MTTTTRNEAAERLLLNIDMDLINFDEFGGPEALLNEALAAERRATVERIRERLEAQIGGDVDGRWLQRVFDEEAAR